MSFGSIVGLVPFGVSYAIFYWLSYRFGFALVPNLFEFTLPNINYEELGIESHELDDRLPTERHDIEANFFGWGIKELVHHLFCINLASVLLTIELTLCEIEDVASADTRLMIWHILIPLMTVCLVLCTPVLTVLTIVGRLSPHLALRSHITLMSGVMTLWFYFLGKLDSITGINTDGLQHNITSKFVSELTLLGITAILILGGVGTISNPFYELIKKEKKVSKYDIDKIVSNLKTTNQILKLRQEEIRKHQEYAEDQSQLDNKELKSLEEEVSAILQLKSSINSDLINYTTKLELQKRQNDIQIQISKLIKKLFSIYCLYRLISLFLIKLPKLFFNRLFHENDISQDVLAVTIARIMIQLGLSRLDEDALVNQLSFFLSASLFLCSISSVINTFHSLARFIPHHIKLDTHRIRQLEGGPKSLIRSLLISELLGIYTLLTIIMLRSNLPKTISLNFDLAIGGEPLQVKFVDSWFDKVSITTCFITIVGITVQEFLYNQDEDEEDFFYMDEEKFVQSDKFA